MADEIDYTKISSNDRMNTALQLEIQLKEKRDLFNFLLKLKSGEIKLDDAIFNLSDSIGIVASEVQKIYDIEKNKYKLFYPDPMNENDCAMCGKPRSEHYFPNNKHNGKETPFCNKI